MKTLLEHVTMLLVRNYIADFDMIVKGYKQDSA